MVFADIFKIAIMVIMLIFAKTENGKILKMKFSIQLDNRLSPNLTSTELHSKSAVHCALQCFAKEECCASSYTPSTSTCHLDQSTKCCPDNMPAVGDLLMRMNVVQTCSARVAYGTSMYELVENPLTWDEAVNKCSCLGGKLCEIESEGENTFIKAAIHQQNTGAEGYWLGGYNFSKDKDLEWISNPDQTMPFNDMKDSQPNAPSTQRCLVSWEHFSYQWADYECTYKLPYICEYQASYPAPI